MTNFTFPDQTFPDALRTAEAMPVAPDAAPEDAARAPSPKPHPKRRTKRRPMPRRNRRGIFGVLLSLVVVVVIIIGIFSIFTQVQTTATATQTAIFVRQLAPQITQRYRGNYAGISAGDVIGAGFVPSTWQRDPSIIEDPEGRVVAIDPIDDGSDSDGSFTITFTGGVSEETCNAVLGALKSDNTFEKATVSGTPKAVSLLDTAELINTECAGSSGNFVLQFR